MAAAVTGAQDHLCDLSLLQIVEGRDTHFRQHEGVSSAKFPADRLRDRIAARPNIRLISRPTGALP